MPKSMKLSPTEINKLRSYLVDHKIKTVSGNEYELFRVKTSDIFMVLYKSGTLVFDESPSMLEILNFVMEDKSGSKFYIGTDETGKGEWYGPLVVVGTLLSSEQIKELRKIGVKDSKLLSADQITLISEKLLQMKIERCSRILLPETYNRLFKEFSLEGKNGNDMLAWAHSEVVKDLIDKANTDKIEVIIDKFDFTKMDSRLSSKERERKVDQSRIRVIQMEKGEREIPVATASIIAKHIFEDEVKKMSEKYKIDLKAVTPEKVPRDLLPSVAKTNFKNIKKLLI